MKKVLLIYGGRSTEHEISCKSAESIINNIDNNKYQLHTVFITQNNEWFYNNKKIDNIIEIYFFINAMLLCQIRFYSSVTKTISPS